MPGTVLSAGNSAVDKTDVLPALMELMSGREGYKLPEPFKRNEGSRTGMLYVEATSSCSLGEIGGEWQSKAWESGLDPST